MNSKKQPPEVFYKKTVLKNFLNTHTKIPVFKSLFNQVAALQIPNFLKRGSNTGVFLWHCKIFKKVYFKENLLTAASE